MVPYFLCLGMLVAQLYAHGAGLLLASHFPLMLTFRDFFSPLVCFDLY